MIDKERPVRFVTIKKDPLKHLKRYLSCYFSKADFSFQTYPSRKKNAEISEKIDSAEDEKEAKINEFLFKYENAKNSIEGTLTIEEKKDISSAAKRIDYDGKNGSLVGIFVFRKKEEDEADEEEEEKDDVIPYIDEAEDSERGKKYHVSIADLDPALFSKDHKKEAVDYFIKNFLNEVKELEELEDN